MRVIIYARVSTDEQAESGLSLQAQTEKLRAYASLYDLEVIEEIEDAGESAKTLKRRGLQRALQLLRTGQADGLVVAKLDRLTRSVSDWQMLIDDHFGERPGRALFSVADSIDTRTAGGRLVLNVLLSVAQWEREAIAERTKDALQAKIKRGERVGSVRYGCRLDDDGSTLHLDDAEQMVMTMIVSMRRREVSYRRIAEELNRRGIPAKKGGTWQHTTIVRIVKRHERQANTQRATSAGTHRIRSLDELARECNRYRSAGAASIHQR